jgi:hypothetical protein
VLVHHRRLSLDSRCGLSRNSLADKHEISRFPREVRPCMLGVFDRAGSHRVSPFRLDRCGLPLMGTASAPGTPTTCAVGNSFHGSIPGLHFPCQRFAGILTDDNA